MSQSLPDPMFVADAIGIDFLNSQATPVDVLVEWLASGEDLLVWLQQSQLVSQRVLNDLSQQAGPGELDAIASQARNLREWFRQFVLQYKGQPLPADALQQLEPINRLLARDDGFSQIAVDPQQHALTLQHNRRWRSPDNLLLPIAEAMAEVVCNEDFTHIKQCQGHNCSMLFVDKTKSHARRWCSMAVCGNRAKQAAHRARKG